MAKTIPIVDLQQQIIQYARLTARMIRQARQSPVGQANSELAPVVRHRLDLLWDVGCHNDRLTPHQKETCRACGVALAKMLGQ